MIAVEFKQCGSENGKIVEHKVYGRLDAIDEKTTVTASDYVTTDIILYVGGKEYFLTQLTNVTFTFDDAKYSLTKKENFTWAINDNMCSNVIQVYEWLYTHMKSIKD